MSLLGSCSLLEDLPPQPALELLPPETYLSISSQSVLYAYVDSIICPDGSPSGSADCDTTWTYYFEDDSTAPGSPYDTIGNALQTVLLSTQTLHWWAEDPDGEVLGYFYKWSTDTAWTYTQEESREFIVPIRTAFDIFSFQVSAMDSDSLRDETPAAIVLPVRNSRPEVSFRYRSNPVVTNPSVTHYTYPTRTFVWDVSDADGLESVESVYYILDDTSGTWESLDAAAHTSIVLTDLTPGEHTFYLKVKDVAGAESVIIQYPDTTDLSTPDRWEVLPVVGTTLIIDDFVQDSGNDALLWYQGVLDSIGISHSTWEIGRVLPYSEGDVTATMSYFSSVVWFTAYTGIETYPDAANAISRYILNGGNLFINVTQIVDTSFLWLPLDTTYVINPDGLLLTDRRINSQISSDLDLVVSKLIAVRVRAFEVLDSGQIDPVLGPKYEILYRLQLPTEIDAWTGEPVVAAEYDHRSPDTPDAGKVIFMSLPLHNGSIPILDGEGSAGKFVAWILQTRFGL